MTIENTPVVLQDVTPVGSFAQIHLDLRSQGWSIVPDFLPPVVVQGLQHELLYQWQEGDFRAAGIGRGENRIVDTSIRNDNVRWLNTETLTQNQQIYWQAMDDLRLSLNRELYLGLVDFEAHMSLYEPGAYYKLHMDQFRGIGLREVTAILYLNDNWQESDGGELLLYQDMQAKEAFKRVLPYAGQLVIFLSAEFPHEVLAAKRQRMSITGWFKKRDLN